MKALFWIGNRVLDLLSWVLVVISLVCVATWVSGVVFGTSVVLISTGSMTPAIPQGSATFSINTPASELQLGDVVTVQRSDGRLPVSHRIVDIKPVPDDPSARLLTLKGDANSSDDLDTYRVTEVPKVLFAVPGGGYVIRTLSAPGVLAGLIAIILLLVLRAFFWPLRKRGQRRSSFVSTKESQGEPSGDAAAVQPSADAPGPRRIGDDGHVPVHMPSADYSSAQMPTPVAPPVPSRAKDGLSRNSVLAILALAVSATLIASPQGARADTGDEVTQNQYVRIVSAENPGENGLQPGVAVGWQIGVQPLVGGTGTLRIGVALTSDPALAAGLNAQVVACTVRWVADACAGTSSVWMPWQPVATAFSNLDLAGKAHQVGATDVSSPVWFQLKVLRLPGTPDTAQASFLVGVAGEGEQNPVFVNSAPGFLAATGGSDGGGALWLGMLLAVAGTACAVWAWRTRRAEDDDEPVGAEAKDQGNA